MEIPLHACVKTIVLPPDYFSPGVSVMSGVRVGSLWAIAYWNGQQFRFERQTLDSVWIRVS